MKKNRGFTLIELMISLTILGIIVSMSYTLLFQWQNMMKKSQDQLEEERILEAIQVYLVKDIKMSTKDILNGKKIINLNDGISIETKDKKIRYMIKDGMLQKKEKDNILEIVEVLDNIKISVQKKYDENFLYVIELSQLREKGEYIVIEKSY